MSRGRRGETDAPVPGLLRSQSNTLGRRDHDPPSGGPHTLRSPDLGLLQTFVELPVLLFPVRGTRLDRSTRVDPCKRERFQFFDPLLVSPNKSLQVRFDAKSFSLRTGADLGFEFRVYRNTHSNTILLALQLILRPPHPSCFPTRKRNWGPAAPSQTQFSITKIPRIPSPPVNLRPMSTPFESLLHKK